MLRANEECKSQGMKKKTLLSVAFVGTERTLLTNPLNPLSFFQVTIDTNKPPVNLAEIFSGKSSGTPLMRMVIMMVVVLIIMMIMKTANCAVCFFRYGQ